MDADNRKPSLDELIADAEARRGGGSQTTSSGNDDGPNPGPTPGGNHNTERDDGR